MAYFDNNLTTTQPTRLKVYRCPPLNAYRRCCRLNSRRCDVEPLENTLSATDEVCMATQPQIYQPATPRVAEAVVMPISAVGDNRNSTQPSPEANLAAGGACTADSARVAVQQNAHKGQSFKEWVNQQSCQVQQMTAISIYFKIIIFCPYNHYCKHSRTRSIQVTQDI